jgi:hypothetical protein
MQCGPQTPTMKLVLPSCFKSELNICNKSSGTKNVGICNNVERKILYWIFLTQGLSQRMFRFEIPATQI